MISLNVKSQWTDCGKYYCITLCISCTILCTNIILFIDYYYSTFGFEHLLTSLIEAPPPVLAYFCAFHHLHNVPVGARLSSQQISSFTNRHSDIQRFYTEDQMVNINK